VYVTGTTWGNGTKYDFLTMKFSASASSITAVDNRVGVPEPMRAVSAALKVAHTPNLVTATVRIQCELPEDGQLSIRLFDMPGREIATQVSTQAVKAGAFSTGQDVSHLRQ
jgi:hypothetical protein